LNEIKFLYSCAELIYLNVLTEITVRNFINLNSAACGWIFYSYSAVPAETLRDGDY
jgi:hypothetical protein